MTGDGIDTTQNLFHGTVSGATATQDLHGEAGNALKFDGVNDFIELPSDFDLSEKTVNVWIKADNITTLLGGVYDSDHPGLQNGKTTISVREESNVKLLRFNRSPSATSATVFCTDPINTDEWYMATMSINGSTANCYKNGQLVCTLTDFNESSNGSSGAVVGASRMFDRFFEGTINDLTIFNCALSGQAVMHLYQQGLISHLGDSFPLINEVTIFPNPATGLLTIKMENPGESLEVRVINSLGAMAWTGKKSQTFNIDVAHWPRGIYFLTMEGGAFFKIVKK